MCRAAALSGLLEGCILQFSYILRRSPGFAVIAVSTLAPAIGVNAVVFAALNGLFPRPLNVPQGESLYALRCGNDTYIISADLTTLDLPFRAANHVRERAERIDLGANFRSATNG